MNNNIQNSYLDIVFANRNKAYGAYELRKNYDKRMLTSVLILSLAAALFFSWNYFVQPKELTNIMPENKRGSEVILKEVNIPVYEPLEVEMEQPKAEKGRTAKTQDFSKAKVVKDNALTKPAMKALETDALAGPVDNPGLEGGKAIAMDNSLSEGGNPTDVMSKRGDDDAEPKVKTDPAVADQPLSIVEEMPSFPGGAAALKQYLNNNLRYPNSAVRNEIQGTVRLSFVVNTDGSIVDIKIVRGVAEGCSEEAIRVVKAMPKWKAGVNNGHKVRVKMTIPIKFEIKG